MEFRDILRDLATQTGVIYFEKNDGSLAISSLMYYPAEPVSVNITNAMIQVDGGGLALWDYGETSTDLLITSFELFYKPILPLDSGWSGRVYANRTGLDDAGNMGGEYSGWLYNAYTYLNTERPLSIYCPDIRDDATALALAKIIIKWRMKPLKTLILTCSFAVMGMDIGDKIGVTATCIHVFLQNKRWMITGKSIIPNINGKNPSIVLNLIELGGSNLDEAEEWIEVFDGGLDKTDVFTDGKKYTEVF